MAMAVEQESATSVVLLLHSVMLFSEPEQSSRWSAGSLSPFLNSFSSFCQGSCTHRETDRERGRERNGQREKQTERETDRERNRERGGEGVSE